MTYIPLLTFHFIYFVAEYQDELIKKEEEAIEREEKNSQNFHITSIDN